MPEIVQGGIKFDKGKLRFDLIPPEIEEKLAEVLTHGAEKYGANNWQYLEDFNNRFYAAARRHLNSWAQGKLIDKESGLSTLSHVLCNIVFLLWKEIHDQELADSIKKEIEDTNV